MYRNVTICGAIFVILAGTPVRVIAGPVEIANEIRLQGCSGLSAVDYPLHAQAQLDQAAHLLSRGEPLESATVKSGYRSERSVSIRISTSNGDEGIAGMLVERFCGIVTDPGLQDAGFYRRNGEVWMVLAAQLATRESTDALAMNQRVIDLINDARSDARKCGHKRFAAAGPLKQVAVLGRVALAHAQDMATHDFMSHRGSDGSMPADRATQADYGWRAFAENVAAGQRTAEEVVNTWLGSPGHCANLMSPRYSETAVAHSINSAGKLGIYWVQVFAAKD